MQAREKGQRGCPLGPRSQASLLEALHGFWAARKEVVEPGGRLREAPPDSPTGQTGPP